MKTTFLSSKHRSQQGYALLVVLCTTAASLIILGATMKRTSQVAYLNQRNNEYMGTLNAAEAAAEKVYALMSYDFQTYGFGAVLTNLQKYKTNVPLSSESSYWARYAFSDGQGIAGRNYIAKVGTNYSGYLPSQYPGLIAINSPVYRIISNAKSVEAGASGMTNAVQIDVLLAMVPITTYAIFYNGLLEFSTCAAMEVRGRVHSNNGIYVGTDASLKFYDTVTATDTITSPANAGHSKWNSFSSGNTYFYGTPTYSTNTPSVTLSINMTNTYEMIDYPDPGESPTSVQGEQRLYNNAQVLILVSNTTSQITNSTVFVKLQTSPSTGVVPGADPSYLKTNYTFSQITNGALPFLSVTNRFLDQRENKTNITTQIDVGRYATWLKTNSFAQAKFGGSGDYPTILYVADSRLRNSKELASVRLTNGLALPNNNGLGFSVATPNPLYVWGDYNCTNTSYLASTNTSATVPAALMSDALTILSSKWQDTNSFTISDTGTTADANTTVNAAIITGIMPSTGTSKTTFSGGVHNLPRMLENWSNKYLWLNTSIVNLFTSRKATNQFVYPGSGSYYVPPNRRFSFDVNFMDPAKQPPGVPSALIPIRYNWAVPPANTVTYNVTP